MRKPMTVLAVLLCAATAAHSAPARSAPSLSSDSPLPWIVDDFPAALAQARREGRTLVVEAWAPWCHSCRSMRAYVYTDSSLRRHAGQFVYLDLDTEKARNADFRRQYRIEAVPTLFFIDPANGSVRMRWLGGLTVPQLHALLDDVASGGDTPPALLRRVAQADSLFGMGRNAEAAAAYAGVLAAAPEGWRGYPRAVESILYAYSVTGQNEAGARLALEALPRVGHSPSGLNVASAGLDCAVNAPDSLAEKSAWVSKLEAEVLARVRDHSFETAPDDRSGAYIALLGARDAAGDSAGTRRVNEEWAGFLEGAAAAAKTPEQRAVYDSHRLSAYLELGQPERAIPMLEQSQRDFPEDYNPPARLATAYKAMRDWDRALAASDRAMRLAYGPRKLLIYQTRADILEGRRDAAGARQVMTEAVAFAEALPEGQRSERTIQSLRHRLETMKP